MYKRQPLGISEARHPVMPGREILLARVEDCGHRVSGTERPGYVMDVGFQPDNHGFIGQPEAFLLVGPAAHDEEKFQFQFFIYKNQLSGGLILHFFTGDAHLFQKLQRFIGKPALDVYKRQLSNIPR